MGEEGDRIKRELPDKQFVVYKNFALRKANFFPDYGRLSQIFPSQGAAAPKPTASYAYDKSLRICSETPCMHIGWPQNNYSLTN